MEPRLASVNSTEATASLTVASAVVLFMPPSVPEQDVTKRQTATAAGNRVKRWSMVMVLLFVIRQGPGNAEPAGGRRGSRHRMASFISAVCRAPSPDGTS